MKRLNYYQVHKNKKPSKKKSIAIELGISLGFKKGYEFVEIPNFLTKTKYEISKLNIYIDRIKKEYKRQKYLKRVNIK